MWCRFCRPLSPKRRQKVFFGSNTTATTVQGLYPTSTYQFKLAVVCAIMILAATAIPLPSPALRRYQHTAHSDCDAPFVLSLPCGALVQMGEGGASSPDSDPATGDTLAAGCGPGKGKDANKKGGCVVS